MSDKCDICGGSGDYAIFDMHGRERYDIQCPECFGSGIGEPPKTDETVYEYPPSSASKITSMDDLRAWMASAPTHPSSEGRAHG